MAKPTKKDPPKLRSKKDTAKAKPLKQRLAVPAPAPAAQATAPAQTPPPGASPVVLDRLWSVVVNRRGADPAVSHSARLLSRGTAKIAQKFGEEAVECLIEATLGNHDALVAESADVLYHLIVMWVDAGVRPEDVWGELQRREGVSGVAEKASRPRSMPMALGRGTRKIP